MSLAPLVSSLDEVIHFWMARVRFLSLLTVSEGEDLKVPTKLLLKIRSSTIALLASLQASSFGHLASAEPEINTMDTLETTVQREESTEDTQER